LVLAANEVLANDDDGDVKQLMPTASMNSWLFGDRSWYEVQVVLREMEVEGTI
jgi:hypothetical protein